MPSMHRDHGDRLSRRSLFRTVTIGAAVLQTPGSVCLLGRFGSASEEASPMLGSFGQLLDDCSALSIVEGGSSVFTVPAILIACSLEQSSTDAFLLFCPGSDVRLEATVSPDCLARTVQCSRATGIPSLDRCSAELIAHPHDCQLILHLFPLMRTSSSHSRQPPSPVVAAETAKTCGPVCVFAPGQSSVLHKTRALKCKSPREQSISGALFPRAMLSISVCAATENPSSSLSCHPLPRTGTLTRSFDGRTDFVARLVPLPPVGFVWKSCLFCDLENFDFLHLEIL
jgi:hypothetical protein